MINYNKYYYCKIHNFTFNNVALIIVDKKTYWEYLAKKKKQKTEK